MHTTLIDVQTLASLLGAPGLVVVDCRFDLADTSRGETAYLEGHVPGAVYAHLDRDLSGPKTGANGRHPLPSPSALASTLGRLGIDNQTQVVVYDQDTGMYASRLWWMLRWLGHDAVAVLDGGYAAWVAASMSVMSGAEMPAPRTFSVALRPSLTVTADELLPLARATSARIVDARAPVRFRGEQEPIDPVAGHIPGAVNHFFMRSMGEDGRFKPVDELRREWAASLGGADASQVVCYCGSGVTACHDLLSLEVAGLSGAKLYAGSWSEWVADPARPVATGE